MILKDKKILILGVANHRSIAFGVAKVCMEQGADVCITYQNERLKGKVEKLGDQLGSPLLLPCDVTVPGDIEQLFGQLKEKWGSLDGMVHSLAFAPGEDLKNGFVNTSKDGFLLSQHISAYSLIPLAKAAGELMVETGGSIICMSYLGGEKVIPKYDVMGVAKSALEHTARYLAAELGPSGIRVNVVSPGPIRTLAAAGVSGFGQMLDVVAGRAPLRRNISQEEVGKTSVFLLSDWSSGITGETVHVDAGYHIMGM